MKRKHINIQVPSYVIKICKRIRKNGFQCYVVGGALRDSLLRRKPIPGEWDIATSAKPEDVKSLFEKVIPTGIEHGTVTVVVDGESCEVTTFKQEGEYSDGRHPDRVEFLEDIEKDLARRDFTINAMAYDPISHELIDPYGGEDDLYRRIIRAVGNAEERFREDGLRPLRGARFAAVLGFRMEKESFKAMRSAHQTFLMVSAERKRGEIIKMMSAKRPSVGWELLRKCGYVRLIFPEMEKMIGIMQGGLHKYDVWNHSIMACDFCEGDYKVKLASLLHDIGKPYVREESGKNRKIYAFYRHEQVGAEIVERWMRRMRFSNEEIGVVVKLIENHMINYTPGWTDAAVRRFIRRVGEDRLDELFLVVEADIKARGMIGRSLSLLKELQSRVREQLNRDVPLTLKDLSVNGRDIIKALELEPGPLIGKILKHLLERVIDDPALNRREKLLEVARLMADSNGNNGEKSTG